MTIIQKKYNFSFFFYEEEEEAFGDIHQFS